VAFVWKVQSSGHQHPVGQQSPSSKNGDAEWMLTDTKFVGKTMKCCEVDFGDGYMTLRTHRKHIMPLKKEIME
jgi:hypothetical protein